MKRRTKVGAEALGQGPRDCYSYSVRKTHAQAVLFSSRAPVLPGTKTSKVDSSDGAAQSSQRPYSNGYIATVLMTCTVASDQLLPGNRALSSRPELHCTPFSYTNNSDSPNRLSSTKPPSPPRLSPTGCRITRSKVCFTRRWLTLKGRRCA